MGAAWGGVTGPDYCCGRVSSPCGVLNPIVIVTGEVSNVGLAAADMFSLGKSAWSSEYRAPINGASFVGPVMVSPIVMGPPTRSPAVGPSDCIPARDKASFSSTPNIVASMSIPCHSNLTCREPRDGANTRKALPMETRWARSSVRGAIRASSSALANSAPLAIDCASAAVALAEATCASAAFARASESAILDSNPRVIAFADSAVANAPAKLACASIALLRASLASLFRTPAMPLLRARSCPCGADAMTSTYSSPATPTVTMTAPRMGSQPINLPSGEWSSLKTSQSYRYSYNSPNATSAVQSASHASYASTLLSNAAWITSSRDAEREGGIIDLARARLLYLLVIIVAFGARIALAVISRLTARRKPTTPIRLGIYED